MGSTDDFASKEELVDHIIEREKLLKQTKAEHYKTHFWDFSKDVLGWPDINISLHKDLASWTIENKKKRRLILIPRGHLKSSLITVGYALWKIAQNPEVRILISNATYSMATNFLYQIKNVLQRNEKFKELFGDFAEEADSWRENQIIISKQGWRAKEPTITVYGVGGSLTGQHYDIILLDDVVNRDTITSKDQIDKTINFYKDCLDVVADRELGRISQKYGSTCALAEGDQLVCVGASTISIWSDAVGSELRTVNLPALRGSIHVSENGALALIQGFGTWMSGAVPIQIVDVPTSRIVAQLLTRA